MGVQALPAGVYFQDEGTVQGWSNYPQKPQKQGVLRNVTTPAYKGGNAIEAKQTYINEGGGYHSETIQASTQAVGQDRYYGQAVYIAPGWQFHNQNVTFQQWSPEDPEGPWELMFIQNDDLRIGGSGGFSANVAKVTDLRGTWIRIVTRLKFHASNGAFEIWVNGVKKYSKTGVPVLPKTSRTIRWSSGIYCTGWRENLPMRPSGALRLPRSRTHCELVRPGRTRELVTREGGPNTGAGLPAGQAGSPLLRAAV